MNLKEKHIDVNSFTIHLQEGFWDSIFHFFGDGLISQFMKGLFGNKRKQETFQNMKKAYRKKMNSFQNEYEDQINVYYRQLWNDFEVSLEELFRRINGIGSSDVIEAILRLDMIMSSLNFYSSDLPYIPYPAEKGLRFVRNKILLELEEFREKNVSESVEFL